MFAAGRQPRTRYRHLLSQLVSLSPDELQGTKQLRIFRF
jgi:hypothetical protein